MRTGTTQEGIGIGLGQDMITSSSEQQTAKLLNIKNSYLVIF